MTDTSSTGQDDLPPFAQLVNDEDRERKAGCSSPGTYHVIVNPDSFQHLPEYSDDPEIKRERLSPLRRGSIAASLASSMGRDSAMEGVPLSHDPNIVVLPRFEDANRLKGKSPPSPTLTRIKTEDFEQNLADAEIARESMDEKYLHQFKDVVWRQLVPAEVAQLDGMEASSVVILEGEAAFFPPVSQAHQAPSCTD